LIYVIITNILTLLHSKSIFFQTIVHGFGQTGDRGRPNKGAGGTPAGNAGFTRSASCRPSSI
jgi:hypothetical protein